MITYGNIYIITKNFEAELDFYKKLFERDTACQNKTRYAVFQMDGLGLSIMNGEFDEKHPDEVEKQKQVISVNYHPGFIGAFPIRIFILFLCYVRSFWRNIIGSSVL